MWTLLLMYAMRSLFSAGDDAPSLPPHVEHAAPPALELPAPMPAEPSLDEMTVDQIAERDPIVREYAQHQRSAAAELDRLRQIYGAGHPRVREAVSRQRVMSMRVEEMAAKFRTRPKSLVPYQNPTIRKSMQAIDQIDIELDMLRDTAGPTHPRVRALRHFREQHEKQIEKTLWGGTT